MNFTKILIANRGEIACRIIRTAKALGYRTVAVYSEADAQALHVAMADEAVCIGPAPVRESYLNVAALLAAARSTGADAVHPGYGFLSENDSFAQACLDAGLVFIGPDPQAILKMGNKAGAKRLMLAAGVPCVPGYQGTDQSDATLLAKAGEIGFPIMVKAAAGGGGRGMKVAKTEDDLAEAVSTARSEAKAAFGNGDVYIEKYLEKPRHIKIQVLGDGKGRAVHLGERRAILAERAAAVAANAAGPASVDDGEGTVGAAGEGLSASAPAPSYAAVDRTLQVLSRRTKNNPVLIGEPGVGKTELAKALAKVLGRPLIRLQCYDGMEQREALYEWNHAAQLLHMRAAATHAGSAATPQDIESEVYQKRFLVKRPLLEALQTEAPGALLLIDEVDRTDEPFEAFLLEYLGEYQVSIPELGTIKAEVAPITILTSNRTRDLNDAVKRRCLYQWMDYPDRERELAVVRSQVPQASAQLTEQVAEFVGRLRSQPFASAFQRAPGIAESVEWAKALVALDTLTLDPEVVQDTVGILFKQREDIAAITPLLDDLLAPAPTVL